MSESNKPIFTYMPVSGLARRVLYACGLCACMRRKMHRVLYAVQFVCVHASDNA